MTVSFSDISNVLKLRIGTFIALSAVAGMLITPGPAQPSWRVAVLVVSILMCASAAGAFNQFFERDLDARMTRTRNRPFVAGRLAAGPWWLAGIALMLVAGTGLAAMLGWVAAAYVLLGALTYGVVYTVWLKRRTAWNIVVGGLSGSFAVLAGAAVVDPTPRPLPVALAMILFLWTPPHFWSLALARRDDYVAAGVPMLPVLLPPFASARVILAHAVVLVAVSFVPVIFGLGPVYFMSAAVGGAVLIALCLRMVADPTSRRAMGAFLGSLVQLLFVIFGVTLEAL